MIDYGLGKVLGLGLTVEGGEALAGKLEALGFKQRRRELLTILRAAAVPIQGRASELAPFDPRTNRHLKDWIVISPLPAGEWDAQAAVAVGPASGTFWGLFVEFGYGPGVRHARPFMRPAFDYGTDRALALLREGFADLLFAANEGIGPFDYGDVT